MSVHAINAAALPMDRGVPGHLAVARGGRSLRWDELRTAVARAAGAWRDCGVEHGECVQLHVPRGIDMAIAYLGAVWAGAVPVPVPLAREVALAGQQWDAQAPCRFILARSRAGYPEAWRDCVVTLDEWAMYCAQAAACAPQRMPSVLALLKVLRRDGTAVIGNPRQPAPASHAARELR